MKALKFRGPAHVFDCEEDAFRAVENRDYREGEVIVIRYEGPKGGPGMREMLSTTAALYGQGAGDKVAPHRRALLGRNARVLHRPRRAGGGRGRPDRARRGWRHHRHRRGDGTLDLEVEPEELERRRARWVAPANSCQSGALRKYADQVGPARYGGDPRWRKG